MRKMYLAGTLLVAMVALFSGCAGQKLVTYGPMETEAIASKMIMAEVNQSSAYSPCPVETPAPWKKGDIHLGRYPVNAEKGYNPRMEYLATVPLKGRVLVEQGNGKWIKGAIPKGTVFVVDMKTKEVLRICQCANRVTSLSGKALYVDLPPSISVKTQLATEVASQEAILHGRVTPSPWFEGPTSIWFVYREEGKKESYATPPHLLTSGGDSRVEAMINGLKPNTRYHYRVVAKSPLDKMSGETFWFLSDKKCLGSGAIASGLGGGLTTFGLVNIANPAGWVALPFGVGFSIYSLVEEDSDPTCKAIAGVIGGVGGAVGGMSYKNSHKSSSSSSSSSDGQVGDIGPDPPNGPGPVPIN